MTNNTKRAVIMGATSGLGYEVARLLLADGWKLGVAGRREENLKKLHSEYPGQVCIKAIDVKDCNADKALLSLIDELGGMDMYFHSSGIGYQNARLDADIELNTLETNGTGFTRLVGTAFRYFKRKRHRTYCSDKLHCRYERFGSGTCIFCNKEISEHIY